MAPVSDSNDRPTQEVASATVPSAEGDSSFRPGDRLGRYVLLSVLGQGGMSIVYLAYDPELDRRVALKLMRAGLIGTLGRSRLQREAQALARLSHPNVVPVYDVGSVPGSLGEQAFVAMEHVEGETLKQWLKKPRTFRQIMEVMLDAGRGLAAAHRGGLVHRDFKPDNVLIGSDGRVRVVDFGLARTVEDLSTSNPSERTPEPRMPPPRNADNPADSSSSSARRNLEQVTRADQIIGTPAYMAPEQVLNGATDERADQFSFCVSLYEALWKAKPFEESQTVSGSRVMTIAEKKIKGKPRPLAAPPPKSSDIPRWVEKIVMRGLSLDPVDRWPSMDELLRQLSNDPAQRRWRWILAAAATAVVGVGLVSTANLRQRERELCRGGRTEVARVWNIDAKDQIRTAFIRLGLPYAEAAASTFTRALDEYTSEWGHAHQDACEATRLRGEQSEEVLDLRMACLSDRLKGVNALTEVMRHPDIDAVHEASRAVHLLTPVAECADIAALKGAQPRPRDPTQRARVDELMRRLADMQASYAVGHSTAAAKMGDVLLQDAVKAGWGPLVAEVQLWRGRATADLGDEKQSVPAYRDAFSSALASRNDRVLRQAAVRLAQEYIYQNNMSEYRYWAQVSQAAIDRTGPDPKLETFLAHTQCVALWQSGKMRERLDCLKKHAAKAERVQQLTEWELTTLGLAAADAGQVTEALDWLQRGVDYSVRENGYTHPRTLEMRAYLCKGYLDYGDLTRALGECRAAMKTARDVAPDDKYVISKIELYLGSTLRELKRYDEARPMLEDARAFIKPEGEALVELAQIASATGNHTEALAILKKSLDEDEKELGAQHPNLIVDLLAFGEALLAKGDFVQAQKVLLRAHKLVQSADLSPYTTADVELAYARAAWVTNPAERAQATALGEKSLAIYKQAPRTDRFLASQGRIERWLKNPDAAAAKD
jgi:tetratricopeptide (TPR) repeat protein/tRNA A-37 threonylcarbamoyl transferase component Bud32